VAGRALAFSDPEIVKMAREEYVPVAGDDWYQRRRQDEEGRFFRHVADQGPRKGEGGSTRQGIYCLTPDGRLLAYKNAGQDPGVMREVLRGGLREWKKLPASRRRPGAVTVEDLDNIDPQYTRKPPAGGLILNVYTRILDRDDKGGLCAGTCRFPGGERAAHDHLWLTASDWKALVPAGARKGATFPVPDRVAERLVRFHLIDNTRGEPPFWQRQEVRSRKMTLTVEETTAVGVRLRLDGTALLSSQADPARADRGFDVRLLGFIHYDARKKAIERFDVVAVGEHWGQGRFTPGARPGRSPLGIALELARGDSPADRVPPQAAREIHEYLR
jgi:hypothetical protein